MATFPKDQFDTLPEDLTRTGAHRAPKKKGGGWLGFLAAIVATALLVVGGLYAVASINSDIEFQIPGLGTESDEAAEPTVSATPTVEPLLNAADLDKKRKITITVLNGTEVSKLQEKAGKALKKLKWPVTSTTAASANDIEDTVVYYSNPDDEDVARGLVAALGTGTVRESTNFPGAPVTIVLGTDYATLTN